MARITQILFEVGRVSGELPYYRVLSRIGSVGESPAVHVLFDGHDGDRARQAARSAILSAALNRIDEITAASEKNIIEKKEPLTQ